MICSGHCFGLALLIWSPVDCLDHEFLHKKKSLKNQQIFPANRRLSRWIWWVVLYLRIWRSCLWSVTTGCGWSTRRCCGSFKCRRRRWRRSRVRQKWWPGVERDDGDGWRWEIRIWNWVKRTNQGLLWGNIYRNPLFLTHKYHGFPKEWGGSQETKLVTWPEPGSGCGFRMGRGLSGKVVQLRISWISWRSAGKSWFTIWWVNFHQPNHIVSN